MWLKNDNGIVIDLFTAVTALELSILESFADTFSPIRLSENDKKQTYVCTLGVMITA